MSDTRPELPEPEGDGMESSTPLEVSVGAADLERPPLPMRAHKAFVHVLNGVAVLELVIDDRPPERVSLTLDPDEARELARSLTDAAGGPAPDTWEQLVAYLNEEGYGTWVQTDLLATEVIEWFRRHPSAL